MQRSALRAAALAAALAAVSPAHASIVLNEVVVNPPGADDAREYVEVRATDPAADAFAGVWLLEIEGDATGPGVVENAVDLSAIVPGASGMVLIGHNYATSTPWPAVPADTVRVSLARRGSFAMENGSVTFLLVRGFTGAFGNDLDANDDGVLDATPWAELLDGVAWVDGASGRAYSTAVVALAGGVVDAATRLPDDATPSSAAAWYGGDLAASGGSPDLSTAYDPAHVTAGFPAPPGWDEAGRLTPGAANVPHRVAQPVCGDGVTEGTEECDDGNTADGDCCSSACALEPAATVCRGAAGGCDLAETCTGTSAACPEDSFAPAATVCRGAAGECDVEETCTGASAACPEDVLVPADTVCRAAAGECDVAERCTGTAASCPDDALAPAATPCRDAAGACDLAEECTGTSAACPDDAFAPSGTSCRAAAGACDAAEHCTGEAADCPDDAIAPDGTACDDGDACTTADRCAAGACTGDAEPSCAATPLVCRKAAPAKAPRGAPAYPAFVQQTGVLVRDALATSLPGDLHQVDLLKPAAVCADPAGLAAGEHLVGLQSKPTKTTPRQPKHVKSVHAVQNALGTLRLRLDAPDRVLVPASLALGDAGAEPLAGGGRGGFKCYRVSVAKEPGDAFERALATLEDPLAGERVLELVKPAHLCNPADVAESDPDAPSRPEHLLCYAARLAKTDPKQPKTAKVRVSLDTALGAQVLDAGAFTEVCLPSLRLD